jgi:hypothetical protein
MPFYYDLKNEIKQYFGHDDNELLLANWIKAAIDLMKPQNLFLIGGRGMSKTTEILAGRSLDIFNEMPRSVITLTCDTYVNLLTNILPTLIYGWSKRKFYIDEHFVTDKEPPSFFERPYSDFTERYKNTISTIQGVKIFLTSLDRPSSNAGISVVHNMGDECKYLHKDKLNKLFPTLRGDVKKHGNSPYFLGKTFTTDMPDTESVGEHDWILEMAEKMDKDQAKIALQTGIVVNELAFELYRAEQNCEYHKIDMIKRNMERWRERHKKTRRNLTFFYNVTSFANIEGLTLDYFKNLLEVLEKPTFLTSVMGCKRQLIEGEKFYFNLSDKHFYGDGYDYDYFDKFRAGDRVVYGCEGLKYINHNQPLEAGIDVGKMLSMVIGQPQGKIYRILKNIYTIPDDWVDQLCQKFREYFKPHKYKILKLYYDRSANAYKSVGQDIATKIKNGIEKEKNGEGKEVSTGWRVILMSVGQGNITHTQEYDLAGTMMGETNKDLPVLRIDKHECKELKSSMEKTPIRTNSKGEIGKDKRSEQLPNHRLPMESTNLSDAFKYLICRKEWLYISKHLKKPMVGTVGEVKVY